MQPRQIGLASLALLQLVSSLAFAQIGSTDKTLPSRQSLARHGLELAWWGQGVMNHSRDKVEHLCCDEDCVYVQSTSGIITAFDAASGHRRWAVQLGQFDPPSFRVVTNEEVALVVVGTRMYGLDKVSGKTLWEFRLPGQPSTSPTADDRQVFAGMLDGSIYAFDLHKVHKLFAQGRLPEWSHQVVNWRFQTSREITSPPMIFGTRVCMASRDGNVYALSVDRPKLVFQFETDAPVIAPIARVNDILYLASEDFSFYALRVKPRVEENKGAKKAGEGAYGDESLKRDKDSGKVIWEFTSGLPIRKAPYPIGKDVFIIPDRGGLYCLDAQTGEKVWPKPQFQAVNFVAASVHQVYATDRDNNLIVLSRESGSFTGGIPLRRFTVRFANDRTDRVIVSTESGLVMVLREIGRNFPTFHMYPDRLPLMPEFTSEEGDGPAEEMPGDGEMEAESTEEN